MIFARVLFFRAQTLCISSMAKRITFDPQIAAVRDRLLSSTSKAGWLVLSYEGKTHIALTAQGDSDNVDDWVTYLKDDDIQYVLMRLPKGRLVEDLGLTATKDVFITWTGPNVGRVARGMKKGDFADVSGHCQPHHVDVEAINKKNITNDNVRFKTFGAGSHVID